MDLTPASEIDRTLSPFGTAVAHADVAIVGAGLAGAALALVLARAGRDVVVIDPQTNYPTDFRCEKLMADQVELLRELGVHDLVAARLFPGSSVALTERGFRYDELVNAVRGLWPAEVRFVCDQVAGLETVEGLQRLSLASGAQATARLCVLATGPTGKLRRELGIERQVRRERHSICIGFTLAAGEGKPFPSQGFVHHSERAGDRIAFASVFPWPGGLRVNLFTYHDPREPWVRALRADPLPTLFTLLPGLRRRLSGACVVEPAEIRSTDLYGVTGHLQPGLVLIGDAFASTCPATGTGVSRILTEVRQLAQVHLPVWLATPGMGVEKIARFYDDPIKLGLEANLRRRAETGRAAATRTSLPWRARRGLVALKRGLAGLRRPAAALVVAPPPPAPPLQKGQWVEVRSAAEIAATLDASGALDGLPFMPEMAALVGRRFRVHRRADRTCVEGFGLRRLDGVVLLEAARCDGSAHDGCQRHCLMFWKEAWLRPSEADAPATPLPVERTAKRRLANLPTRDGDTYLCQSTRLAAASAPTPKFDSPQLVREVVRGELAPVAFVGMILRAGLNRARRLVRLPDLGVLRGLSAKPRRGKLGLAPGDWVRIKDSAALRQVLTPDARNNGLTFEPEMAARAGETHQVDYVVEQIIHEETGKMVRLSRTVALRNLDCRGACARNCPRANPLYWRESWLERVEAPKS